MDNDIPPSPVLRRQPGLYNHKALNDEKNVTQQPTNFLLK
jgi:hypothetical protein